MKKEKEFYVFYIDYRAIYLKPFYSMPDMSIIDAAFSLYNNEEDRTCRRIINEVELEKFLIREFDGSKSDNDHIVYEYKKDWYDDFDGWCHFKVEIYCNDHSLKYGDIDFPLVIIDQYKGGQCERDGLTVIRFEHYEDFISFINQDRDIAEVRSEVLNRLSEIKH